MSTQDTHAALRSGSLPSAVTLPVGIDWSGCS